MIKSVRKATSILSVLADSYGSPLPLSVISERVKINKSTCAHIVKTLEQDGFAVKISASRGYVLGPAAYYLSRFGGYDSRLSSAARPMMRYLYQHTKHTVVLAVLQGTEKYILDYLDDGAIFQAKESMIKDNIYRTATGRVILSHLPKEELLSVIKKHGMPTAELWEEAHSLEALEHTLRKVRECGIEKSRTVNENTVSIGYGAPIFHSISCVGALGIAVKLTLENEKHFDEEERKIKKLLIGAARQISAKLEEPGE